MWAGSNHWSLFCRHPCIETLKERKSTPVSNAVECGQLQVDWVQLLRFNIHNKTMKIQPTLPTSGKILAHCKRMVYAFRESLDVKLCVFKIGVTADPMNRFSDYMTKAFTVMWVLYISDDLGLTHMLEAALISEFHTSTGCRNAPESGGEGGLNRKKHLGPPFFTYITGGRADQLKRVG